jgi:hypothetical protein
MFLFLVNSIDVLGNVCNLSPHFSVVILFEWEEIKFDFIETIKVPIV